MNYLADDLKKMKRCIAVTLISDLARSIRQYSGANCFLKGNYTVDNFANDGAVTNLRMCVDRDCSEMVAHADWFPPS